MGFFSTIFGEGEKEKSSLLSDEKIKLLLQESIKLMTVNLVAAYPMLLIEKKLKGKSLRTGKERYYLSICFLFGMHASNLDELINNQDERMAEYMQSIVHLFHLSIPAKIKKTIFQGVKFEPNKEGGFSQQNSDVCKWYIKKRIKPIPSDNFHKVKITGSHFMHLYIKKKLSTGESKMYKKMGSYINTKIEPSFALNQIFRDNKTKFKF